MPKANSYPKDDFYISLICANCICCEGCPILPLLHGELCVDFVDSHPTEVSEAIAKYKEKICF